jgi:hypothetical protein
VARWRALWRCFRKHRPEASGGASGGALDTKSIPERRTGTLFYDAV